MIEILKDNNSRVRNKYKNYVKIFAEVYFSNYMQFNFALKKDWYTGKDWKVEN